MVEDLSLVSPIHTIIEETSEISTEINMVSYIEEKILTIISWLHPEIELISEINLEEI